MLQKLRDYFGNDGCTAHHYPDISEGTFLRYEVTRDVSRDWKIVEHRELRCQHEGCHETIKESRTIGYDTGNALDGFFHDCKMRHEYDN